MSTNNKRAFITGVFGQDGSYLSEYLLKNGYEVWGLAQEAVPTVPYVQKLLDHEHFHVVYGDLTNFNSYKDTLTNELPDELYNLAAVSDLKTARENPELTLQVNFTACKEMSEYVMSVNPRARFFQALSSRILTPLASGVIDENSPLAPGENAYDIAKRRTLEEVIQPLRAQGFFITGGFLCNHESPRRGTRFVTGKIAKAVADMKKGTLEALTIGNVEAQRDWSYAGDFVQGMHAILQAESPADYVVGSGALHTVQNFIDVAFSCIDVSLRWEGEGVTKKAYDSAGKLRVAVDPQWYQIDDNPVVSNITKIQTHTGWRPEVTFEDLVRMMVEAELKTPRE